MIALLLACAGPSEDTLVDELRVLSITPEVPEAAPGQQVRQDTLVVDPFEDHRLLQWTCTSLAPGSCLEAESEDWEGLSVDEPRGSFTVSAALASVATDEPLPLVRRWALACEEGLCPVFDELDAGLTEALRRDLQAPTELLRDLPFEGVSLAVRGMYVSSREDPATQPTLTCAGPWEVEPAGTAEFSCAVEGRLAEGAALWGYTSAGGWVGASVPLRSAEVGYSLVAPEEAGPVQLWVIVEDGASGSAVWSGSIRVR